MADRRTYREIAVSWELWQEYVDPGSQGTREKWDAMTIEERIAFQVACFGAEPECAICAAAGLAVGVAGVGSIEIPHDPVRDGSYTGGRTIYACAECAAQM
jgi:hypothetical protein